MANLRDIRRRISSVKSTQQITRAMKMVSAAKLRRAQERMQAARPYAAKIDEVIASLALRAEAEAHPLLRPPGGDAAAGERDGAGEAAARQITLMVVAADRGLCGSFNSNVLRRGMELISEYAEAEVSLLTLGRKCDVFRRREVRPIVKHYEELFNQGFDFGQAREIGGLLTKRFLEGEADEVVIVYNKFHSTLTQRVEELRLLPITPEELPESAMPPVDFLYEPGAAQVLDSLLERHVNTQVFQVMLESTAGEHGARMAAMDNATSNAAEMIDKLTLFYNRARQANITRELIEVVSGADALSG